MHILFPSLPIAPREPDPDFLDEYRAAQAVGFSCVVYELEALRAGEVRQALKYCRSAPNAETPLLYRGWMVSETDYTALYHGLLERGYLPITPPEAYAEAHYLPRAYTHLRDVTPYTVWMSGADGEVAWELYQHVRSSDAIVKDYVKSAKHRWREACFLPANTSQTEFEDIIGAFLAERGPLFEHGLVFRRYHKLIQLGADMRGMPIHEEYRLFCWDGKIIAQPPFRDPQTVNVQRNHWQAIAARFHNRFISLDVARQEDETWIVVEVGDGGVSGLPLSIPAADIYAALAHIVAQ